MRVLFCLKFVYNGNMNSVTPAIYPINTRMFTHIGSPIEMPELNSITAPGGSRVYNVPGGNTYPSVTTVLGAKEKPWLTEWQQSLGQSKAKKEMERCATRGTAIHEMAEKYLNNETNFTKNYDAQHVRGFNQLKFKLNQIDNIRLQEAGLYSDRLKLAGRVDCIGEYDGVLNIIDFKTSNNNKSEQMIEDYFIQCTAYAIMWHHMTGEAIERVTILMSVEKGMVPLIFQDSIDKYVSPLLQRIGQYKENA